MREKTQRKRNLDATPQHVTEGQAQANVPPVRLPARCRNAPLVKMDHSLAL